MRPAGAHLRLPHRPLWPRIALDGQRGFPFPWLSWRADSRQSHIFPGDACALRIGMGGEWASARRCDGIVRRVGGDFFPDIAGAATQCRYLLAAVARFCPAGVGLAANVWLAACRHSWLLYIPRVPESEPGSSIARHRRRGAQDCRRSVKGFLYLVLADDIHECSFARHAGPVPGFLGSVHKFSRLAIVYGHHLQHRSHPRRHRLRAILGEAGQETHAMSPR